MSARQSVLVCGLGMTGMSLARHWLRKGAKVAVMDTRAEPPFLARLRDELPECTFERAEVGRMAEAGAEHEIVALSPGLSPERFAGRQCRIVGDLMCFFDDLDEADGARRPQVLAVTGTNGKSTLASMLAHMLNVCGHECSAIGNIGTPVLDALGQWDREEHTPEFVAVEMSSFQLETAGRIPARVSVVLNVGEDHLDRHDSLDSYVAIKAGIYRGAQCAAVNRSNAHCAAISHSCPEESGFAPDPDDARDGDWRIEGRNGATATLSCGGASQHVLRDMQLAGAGLQNALAAMSVTEPLGIAPDERIGALAAFKPLPHRMTPAGIVGTVSFYDDSKATNVDAAIAAMYSFDDGRTILIAGGDAKAQQFGKLAAASLGKVGHFVLIGADADGIAAALADARIPSSRAASMQEAVVLAYRLAPDQGRVILSPACSSLDMYSSYADRGDDFVRSIRGLSAGRDA